MQDCAFYSMCYFLTYQQTKEKIMEVNTMLNWLASNGDTITAICALLLTSYSIANTKRHDRLSVRPDLGSYDVIKIKDGVLTYGYYLNNYGLGPALIKNFTVLYKGKVIAKNDMQAMKQSISEKINEHFSNAEYKIKPYTKGITIPNGEKRQCCISR